MKGRSQFVSTVVVAGLLLIWGGERVADRGSTQVLASGIGAALIALALGLRAWRLSRAGGADFKYPERLLLLLHVMAAGAVALYFVQSDALTKFTTETLETSSPKLAGALAVLWPALLACSQAPTLLVELAYAAMARAPKLELGRIREALFAGLGFAFAMIFAVAMQYIFTERDVKRDFSHFRVAKPGAATKNLAQSFDENVDAVLFFPPGSDVGEFVDAYFDELRAEAPKLLVTHLDYALEPVKSKELGVTSNGTVVIRKGSRKESVFIGTEVEKSKTQLRALDVEVQKRLLQVAKSTRTVYFTSGHGERTQEAIGGTDKRGTIDLLNRTLQEQNFDVKTLSSAEGLGAEVPRDAAAVFILGPRSEFTEVEAQTLAAYEKRGGKLFIGLDPENGLAFDELMKPLGLSFTPQVLANDAAFARMAETYSPSDRRNIVSRSYSSHPSVTQLSRYQAPIALMGAGALDELKAHEAGLSIDFAVKSLPSTWNDANSNFEADSPAEVRKVYNLVAAVNRRGTSNNIQDEMRVLVLGDSDAITDTPLRSVEGNRALVIDGLKWLLGEEQLQGATSSEQDVTMVRTKEQDNVWFYGTTVFAPLAVMGVGMVARRKPKKKNEVTP